jgi:Domain of unknown function (DUF4126)
LHLVFDICAGLGVAAAVGIRPFLPALVVCLLAAAGAQIHFNGTDYSFLQSVPFLIVLFVLAVILLLVERRYGPVEERRGPAAIAFAVAALALGALLFAGSLARDHYTAWPGLIAGVLCAAVGLAATRPLFARVRARLDSEAAAAVPLYAEGSAVLLGGLSVVAPPVGVIGLLLLGWLLLAGRRREGQKYAGLRILR